MTQIADFTQATQIYNGAAAVGSGSVFALPPHALLISWQLVYGTPPASITANLQVSNDGVNFQTIDNTTAIVNGVVRITAVTAKFIRINISAVTGGDTIIVTIAVGSLGSGKLLFGQGPALVDVQEQSVGLSGGGITEEILYQFTIPARTFVTTGMSFRLRAFGHTGANANTKTIRVHFGGDSWIALGGAVNNVDWTLEFIAIRRSFGVFIRRGNINTQGVLPGASVFAASVDETQPIVVTVTGQTSLATANDVTVEGVIVDCEPGIPGINN